MKTDVRNKHVLKEQTASHMTVTYPFFVKNDF